MTDPLLYAALLVVLIACATRLWPHSRPFAAACTVLAGGCCQLLLQEWINR